MPEDVGGACGWGLERARESERVGQTVAALLDCSGERLRRPGPSQPLRRPLYTHGKKVLEPLEGTRTFCLAGSKVIPTDRLVANGWLVRVEPISWLLLLTETQTGPEGDPPPPEISQDVTVLVRERSVHAES